MRYADEADWSLMAEDAAFWHCSLRHQSESGNPGGDPVIFHLSSVFGVLLCLLLEYILNNV